MQETAKANNKPLLLEAREITKHFGAVTALDGVSLTLNAGEVLGVVGDNGSQIVILDVNIGEQESWSLNLGYEIEKIRLLSWSPDKNWLEFMAMGETGTSSGVYLIPRGGGEAYQLIDMFGYETVSQFEWISN